MCVFFEPINVFIWHWDKILFLGQAIPMPPQLMELYNLYKQELETRSSKENQFVEDLNNEIIRVSLNSMFVPDKYLSFVRHLP